MTTAPIEVRKIGYRQSKDGFVLSLVIHPNEQHDALAIAPIGARFMAALVEINDDETPVTPPEPAPTKTVKDRRPWDVLPPTTQACIRCTEPVFQTWVIEQGFNEEADKERNAACYIRKECGVNSRSSLSTNAVARAAWRSLENRFLADQQMERAMS